MDGDRSPTPDETVRSALQVLGFSGNTASPSITAAITADDIRAAFRTRVVALHPDITGDIGNEPTLALLDAYRIALEYAEAVEPQSPSAASDPSGHQSPREVPVWLMDHDTIALGCSREEAFARVLEVGYSLGSITYLDREGELLEVLLRTKLGDNVSLVISFQGRNDWVEAFLTSEVLDVAKHELPTTSQIAELYAHQLAARW